MKKLICFALASAGALLVLTAQDARIIVDRKEGVAATALQLSNVVGAALGTGFGGAMVALAVGLARPQAFGVAASLVAMAVGVAMLAAQNRRPSTTTR